MDSATLSNWEKSKTKAFASATKNVLELVCSKDVDPNPEVTSESGY